MAKIKLEYSGRVKGEEIILPKKMRKEILQAFPGKPITVTVAQTARKRSSPQNRYYWLILNFILPFIKDADPENNLTLKAEDLHEFFKGEFLGTIDKAISADGDTIQVVRSTTDLSKDEMGQYIDLIAKFSIEFFNAPIPLPEEQMEAF